MLSQAFHAIWTILDDRGRRRLVVVLALMLATAVLEALGTGSILPFVALLVDPDLVERSPALTTVRNLLGIESRESFLVAFGIAIIGLIALVNGANMLLIVGVQRFTWREGARIGESLFRGWLAWPWVKQAHLHSAEATRLLFTEITQTVSSVMIPFMTLLARSLAILAIAAVLVAIDPATTMATLVVFGGFYVAVYLWLRQRFAAASRQSSEARAEAAKTATETFGNLKDVRVLGLEAPLTHRFMAAFARNGELQARSQIAAQLPRYVFETVAFGGLTAIAIAEISRRGAGSAAISLVATFAFAGYRILPALQQAYASAALLRASLHAATEMAEAVSSVADFEVRSEVHALPPASRAGPPEIQLQGVSFRFPGTSRPMLADVSLEIPPKSFVLIVGETGSGKTTLVDLVAGLLEPSAGRILVDGEPLSEDRVPAWRARLGYVAQTPMILDDSIAANIAVGFGPGGVSEDALASAVAGAQLDRTLRDLPEGLATRVGERGGRLSGGQRQRLAIARALFRGADVLILDESTSALDEETERAVLDTLAGLRGRMTVLMISHRPPARFDADLVVRVEHGTARIETARPARASVAARS